jgi:hypothetical protein
MCSDPPADAEAEVVPVYAVNQSVEQLDGLDQESHALWLALWTAASLSPE